MYSSFVGFKVVKKVLLPSQTTGKGGRGGGSCTKHKPNVRYFLQKHLESNQSHSHQSVPHTDTTSGYSSALPHRWLLEVICQKKSCAHQWILKQQLCRRRGEKAEQPPFVFFFGQLKFITRMAAEWRGLRGQCGRRSFVPLLATCGGVFLRPWGGDAQLRLRNIWTVTQPSWSGLGIPASHHTSFELESNSFRGFNKNIP